MTPDRSDRQIPFFGKAGQEKLAACEVAIVGVGGLGTHVVQQLAYLGVNRFSVIDSEELDETNLNRYIGSRHDDPIPGTPKVDLAERVIQSVNPRAEIRKVPHHFPSPEAFVVLKRADVVFGCLDNDGGRLVLSEFCAAYERRYLDLATEIIPGSPLTYGGRVCVSWERPGCVVCYGLLDMREAAEDLAGPNAKRDREALYGVPAGDLDRTGPSVVSINGVVASLAVTEFAVAIAGIRRPCPVLTYRTQMGGVAMVKTSPPSDCYYCNVVRGQADAATLDRYL